MHRFRFPDKFRQPLVPRKMSYKFSVSCNSRNTKKKKKTKININRNDSRCCRQMQFTESRHICVVRRLYNVLNCCQFDDRALKCFGFMSSSNDVIIVSTDSPDDKLLSDRDFSSLASPFGDHLKHRPLSTNEIILSTYS